MSHSNHWRRIGSFVQNESFSRKDAVCVIDARKLLMKLTCWPSPMMHHCTTWFYSPHSLWKFHSSMKTDELSVAALTLSWLWRLCGGGLRVIGGVALLEVGILGAGPGDGSDRRLGSCFTRMAVKSWLNAHMPSVSGETHALMISIRTMSDRRTTMKASTAKMEPRTTFCRTMDGKASFIRSFSGTTNSRKAETNTHTNTLSVTP